MRFALNSDQAALREAVRDLLRAECPPAVVRAGWPGSEESDLARVRRVWDQLGEMGVLGAAVPEADGGLGLGAVALVGLLEEAGRAALPLPLMETAFVAGPLLAAAGEAALVERLAAGELVVGAALDGSGIVPFAQVADALIAGDARAPGGELRLLRPPAFAPLESIDGARGLGRVAADAGLVLDLDAAALAAAWERGALGAAAQLLGLGRALLALAADYVTERRQFGVAIGTFQAVKHQLADALLALEFAAPAVLRAAWSLDRGAGDAGRDVAVAKALASDAALQVAATALQVHGAIAYTVEYDLHLHAKRVWAGARAWGDADWQRTRVAAALGLLPEEALR
ncbi:acyl-CoA dehydrogenase family protein [Conexibacter sp. JD483]|uniref:acyl-CoA dehydrogenase family protein n=1 Tax=unclassified Conexibacter TaxID=2627773 RepID=UPI0027206C01|nr:MULTISPECIES: acyl-CoA dehydrogenase family protein [unclassified Conexibacter]MDO8186818.1 acyl-CoA dehydrogenase family protein [Conexibacter sp. CPCC 205706]MDO8197428.1 acyl-CoA dehydrogenase family protein [Conexibacter sp. CPCC 205762]MDR9371244.1 acyl-CoA dehydrogenase family protein [Conexibacter sp. JD483]